MPSNQFWSSHDKDYTLLSSGISIQKKMVFIKPLFYRKTKVPLALSHGTISFLCRQKLSSLILVNIYKISRHPIPLLTFSLSQFVSHKHVLWPSR